MLLRELILPFYCPLCKSLTFLYKQEKKRSIYCDFIEERWKEHPCGVTNPEELIRSEYVKNIHNIEWGNPSIPYRTRETKQKSSKRTFTLGIILSTLKRSEDRVQYSLLTLSDYREITLEIKGANESIPAGILINMEGAIRIGPEKYRLQKLEQINMDRVIPYSSEKEQYGLLVSCDDSVLLETHMSRFISCFKENQIYPTGLIPLKIKILKGKQIHRRQLTIPANKNLSKVLKQIAIPDSIEMEIKQQENRQIE